MRIGSAISLGRAESAATPKSAAARRRTRHTPEGAAVTDLILAVFRANGRLMRTGDDLTRDLGLTAARWQILGAIREAPRTVAQIARSFESTRQGVLWVVSALAKDALVELVANPDHKRAKLVRCTDEGQRAYEHALRRQETWVNGFAGGFAIREIRLAIDVIERLGRDTR